MLKNKRLWWAGGLVVAYAALTLLLSPVGSVADEHEKPMMEGKANHFSRTRAASPPGRRRAARRSR